MRYYLTEPAKRALKRIAGKNSPYGLCNGEIPSINSVHVTLRNLVRRGLVLQLAWGYILTPLGQKAFEAGYYEETSQ